MSTGCRLEGEQRAPADFDLNEERVSRQRLAADDVPQLESKALEWRQAAGLQMEMAEIEAPAIPLMAAVLAHDAVKPALHAAGQVEIRGVDSENERIVEDGAIEPVGDYEFDASGVPAAIGAFRPFVDPGEAVHPPPSRLWRAVRFRPDPRQRVRWRLAQRRRDRRRLQPVQRRLEALIVTQRCAAPGEVQYLVGRRRHQARRAQAGVARLDDLGRSPDQNVGVPDRGHAMLGDGFDADCNVA